MKSQTLVAVAIWTLMGLTAGVAYGQERVKVKVPFEFVVEDRNLPQGEYLISAVRDEVIVQNSEGKTLAMVLTNPVSGHEVGTTGLAIFQCYERRCFLSEVWSPTAVAGRQLMRSRGEKEIAKRKAPTYFALVAEEK